MFFVRKDCSSYYPNSNQKGKEGGKSSAVRASNSGSDNSLMVKDSSRPGELPMPDKGDCYCDQTYGSLFDGSIRIKKEIEENLRGRGVFSRDYFPAKKTKMNFLYD